MSRFNGKLPERARQILINASHAARDYADKGWEAERARVLDTAHSVVVNLYPEYFVKQESIN